MGRLVTGHLSASETQMNHPSYESEQTRHHQHGVRHLRFHWIPITILLLSLRVTTGLSGASFPIQITELMYHPLDGKEFEFVEIQNTGSAPVDLSLASWNGIEYRFEEADIIQSNEIWVLASNDDPEAFQARYPNNITPHGYFAKKLSDGGEKLTLSDTTGHPIAWANYSDSGFWPSEADGLGYSLERANQDGDPNSPTSWRRSLNLNGSPGSIPSNPPLSQIRISEIYATSQGNDETDVDFIELWNPTDSAIDLSGWRITDSGSALDRLILPEGTVIDAAARLSLPLEVGDELANDSAGFALSSGGETLFVYDSLGQAVDSIRFGQQVAGYSLSRIEDQWQLSFPTSGIENTPAPLADPSALSINEWKADAEDGDTDWIELYNPNPNLPISLAELCIGHGDIMELTPEEVTITPFGAEWTSFRGTVSPTPDDLTAWTRPDFVTEGWEQLEAPFFTGTNPGEGTELIDMAGNYTSLLIRRGFNIVDRDQYQTYRVKARSDDGFIAWFNGSEWGRLHLPSGPPTVDLLAESDGPGDFTDWSFDFDAFALFLTEGHNTVAVQGVSSERSDNDFYIDFSLAGVLPSKTAFTITRSSPLSPLTFIPPNGFLRLNASEKSGIDDLQFRLPPEGTTLALINSDDELITSAKVSVASEGVSEGRFPDGADHITYFTNGESPGRSNLTDKDEDQIPDADELELGLDPTDPNDADLDRDGDGISNLQEYLRGTDLNDPKSFFALQLDRVLPNGTLKLTAPRLTRQDYILEMADELTSDAWIELVHIPARDGGDPGFMTVDVTIEQSMAFFRIAGVVLPPEPGSFQVELSPPSNQTGHQPAQPLILSLTEALLPETLKNENAWVLTDPFGRDVEIQVRFDAAFTQVTLVPRIPLRNNTSYQVSIDPAVTTASGRSLANEIGDWRFTTASSRPLIDDPSVYTNDNDEVLRLDLTIFENETPFTLEDLLNDHSKHDDFDPSVRVRVKNDTDGPGPTESNGTMKVRGSTSRAAIQKSFRIRLDNAESEWRGHRQINLMKHPFELSRVRNRLSFELFEQIPNTTSLRTQYVHLFINGEDFGLYSQIEHYDTRFLQRHGLDPNGNLYKAAFFEWFRYPENLKLKSDPTYTKESFETRLEIESSNDHEKLLRLLEDINNVDLDFSEVFDQYFDRANYLTWLSCNLLTGNIDTNSQNFMIYSPSDSQTWYFLPWDYDGAWGLRRQPDNLRHEFPRWQEGLATYWNVSLHKRIMQIPQNRIDLEKKIAELRADPLSESNIKSILARYRPIVESFVSQEPDIKLLPVSRGEARTNTEVKLAEWANEFDRLPSEIPFNAALYFESLERPMPIFLGTPQQTTTAITFSWSESLHLGGRAIEYDFALSTSPLFEEELILERRTALTELSTQITPIPPFGTYYFRIIIRTSSDPGTNWQIPFSSFFDESEGRTLYGIKQFSVK